MSGWKDFPFHRIAEEACTPRQLEVLEMLATYDSVRRVARIMDMSPSTVRDHREAAFRRIRQHPEYVKLEEVA